MSTATGRLCLSVRRTRRGWRVLGTTTINAPGSEVVSFGPEYATEEAALASLESTMEKVVKVLDELGLKHGDPQAFA